MVLNTRDEDTTAHGIGAVTFPVHAFDSEVIGFGAAGGEYHFSRVAADGLGDAFTRVFDSGPSLTPDGMQG